MSGLDHLISVPGRLCISGEHSDWAADYRQHNPDIPAGTALVIGLNQCITATARALPDDRLSFHSALAGELDVALPDLLAVARSPTAAWRFAAASAHLMAARFTAARGLRLRVLEATLPAARGFSSSAAVCVLVVRAYNAAYRLGLSVAGEMEAAYAAERLTGSMCGRMDQIVAIGAGRVARMHFDFEHASHELIAYDGASGGDEGGDVHEAGGCNGGGESDDGIFLVVADLGRRKDTARILHALRSAYPDAQGAQAERLRRYLGERNVWFVGEMERAVRKGDAAALGRLMTAAQREFDEAATPFCPEELTAPRLHAILADDEVTALVYGGKGGTFAHMDLCFFFYVTVFRSLVVPSLAFSGVVFFSLSNGWLFLALARRHAGLIFFLGGDDGSWKPGRWGRAVRGRGQSERGKPGGGA